MKPSSLLITVAKAEEGYIEEWISYHLKLGFDRIVIGLNDWAYTPRKEFLKSVEVIPLENQQWSPHFTQANFFTRIKDTMGVDFDVVTGFDVDEFLMPSSPDKFSEFLEDVVSRPVTFIHWRIFGDNGLSGLPDEANMNVLKRFTRCANELHPNGKSFISMRCNGRYLKWWNPHFVCLKDTGITIREDSDVAELYHYRNKTKDERYLRDARGIKYEKGAFYSSDSPRFNSLFETYNRNEIINTKARDFMYGVQGGNI